MKIALLTRNPKLYSHQRIMETAVGRGHEIVPIDYLRCYMNITSHNPKVMYQGEPMEGYDAIIPRIPYLQELGVTTLELMPIAQFSGRRNWGYDGVYPFAAQNSYGGVAGLKRLVDACHAAGISVCLDVVYNHLGPEGNYFADFGPILADVLSAPIGDQLEALVPDEYYAS